MATFAERMIGAAKLETATYEEVEHDPTALGQAMGVVVLAAAAAGIGAIRAGTGGFLFGIIAALVGWFVWAGIIYLVGTKLMPEPQTKADIGQLLRTIGFAASPGLLAILGIIPFLGILIRFVVAIWQLIAMVVAVRQALDYQTTGKAVVVVLVGWIAYLVIYFVFAGLAGLGAGLAGLAGMAGG